MKQGYIHTYKVLTFIVLLAALIIGSSVFAQKLLKRDSDKLGKIITEIEKSSESKNWDQAASDITKVSEMWSDVKGTWSALIDHQEIDNIDVTLSRLLSLIQTEEVPSVLSEAAALKKYIEHIPQKEKLDFSNLF